MKLITFDFARDHVVGFLECYFYYSKLNIKGDLFMIVKIRVQCLPEHREQVSTTLKESFTILEESKPQKIQNSKLIKVFYDGLINQEGAMDHEK